MPRLTLPILTLLCFACAGGTAVMPTHHTSAPGDPPPKRRAQAREATGHPNVLILVADDLGTDKVSAYKEHAKAPSTPAIDALAARGTLFRNAYTYSTCSPTRAAVLTGRYGRRNGFGGIVHINETTYELPLEELTLPEMLHQASTPYHSAAVGKWHLSGHLTDHSFDHPNRQGFEDYRGCIGNLPLTKTRRARGTYYDFEKVVNGEVHFEEQYATVDTTDDAIELMDQLEEPWVLYVAYNAPHEPFHVPPDELYPGTVTEASPDADKYDAAVQAMDHEIDRLLSHMSPAQQEDTLVVFLGDNGTPRQAIRPPRNPDHGKSSLYEGGTNVPLILAGPGVASGREAEALIHAVDLFPTIAKLAGVEVAKLKRDGEPLVLDGLDFTGVLQNPSATGPRTLVYTEKFNPIGAGPYQVDMVALRDGRYKIMNKGGKGRWSYFDLEGRLVDGPATKPKELRGEEKRRYQALKKQLEDLQADLSYDY